MHTSKTFATLVNDPGCATTFATLVTDAGCTNITLVNKLIEALRISYLMGERRQCKQGDTPRVAAGISTNFKDKI
jgi:phosphosulfolactate phosphohydrolase-like enzyme